MKQKRIYPTSDPRYGDRFEVLGIQTVDIDGNYSEMLPFELGERLIERENGEIVMIPAVFEIGKDFSDWRKNKSTISDKVCTSLNKKQRDWWENTSILKRSSKPPVNLKDVVALEIRYLGDTNTTIL